MYILHIETSTKICSVAISQDDAVIAWEDQGDEMNHTALLAPMIERVLSRCSLAALDLGAVSISSGPGSYTGLRVGGSTAKAFAYSLGIPLISVPTLESLGVVLFEKYPMASHGLPMIDARRDEVYASLFSRDMTILWPDHAVLVNQSFMEQQVAGLQRVVCCGDGAFKVKSFIPDYANMILDETILCSARNLIRPAWERWNKGQTEDALHYIPRYLKPPNITQPRKTV